MEPADFEESNLVLGKPPEMKDCDPLNVFANGKVVVSCWKITKEELEEILKTGRIWLIVCGTSMPPVIMTGKRPFEGK